MKTQFSQNPVSKTVWQWQETARGGSIKPSAAKAVMVLIAGLAVSALLFYLKHTTMAAVVCTISAVVFFCSRFLPKAYATIENAGASLSRGAGLVLSWLLLVPVYYSFFTFGRLSMKLRGKDPMARSLLEKAESYWLPTEADVDPARYKRQF
jgi:hypothetical protein